MIIRTLDSYEKYKIYIINSNELRGTIEPLIFESKWQGHLITKNRFPYSTDKEHWVLWIQPGYEKFYTEDRINLIIGKCVKYWENPPNLKSIHTIKHYHIYY